MRCVSPSPWSSSVRDTCTLSSDYPRLLFSGCGGGSPRCGPPGRAAPCEAPRRSSARTQWHGRARAWSASVSGNVGWKWAGRGRRAQPSATRHPWTLRTTVTAMAQTPHVHSDRPSQSGRAAWARHLSRSAFKPLAHARHVRGTRTRGRGVPRGFVSNYAGPGLASASTWAWITGPRTGPAWTSGLAPASLLHMLPPKMHGHVTSPVCYR